MDASPSQSAPLLEAPPVLGTYEETLPLLQALRERNIASGYWVDKAWINFRVYRDADEAGVGAGCCDCFLGWLNRRYAEEYKHVELVFTIPIVSDGKVAKEEVAAFTVDLPSARVAGSGAVRCLDRDPNGQRTYPPDKWHCFKLHKLEPLQVYGLFYYCMRQTGKPMNSTGLYWNFLPLLRSFSGAPRREEDSYFCSQLVASALAWVLPAVYGGLDPRTCTPLALFQLLHRDKAVCLSGEFRGAGALEI